jgi:pimeloyl-ACP methyl ester carboxylesterase
MATRGILTQRDSRVLDSLPTIRVPTLIVVGEHDEPFLEACDVAVPPNVRFVPADLAAESLASVLARCGFARSVPAFFSWPAEPMRELILLGLTVPPRRP